MKKLIQYLKQIDPRIAVKIYTTPGHEGERYVIEAFIRDTFTCTVSNLSFKEAKKQFYKSEVTIAIAKEVAFMQLQEEAMKDRAIKRIKEQEEMLNREYEDLWKLTQDLDVLGVVELLEKHNTILDQINSLK